MGNSFQPSVSYISVFCFQLFHFNHMNSGRLSQEFRDRAKAFASQSIRLFIALPRNREEVRIIARQMLRSGTSVAAHVRETSRARSNDEFVSKLGGALQEADETQLWLELLREDCSIPSEQTMPHERESGELIAIMTTMVNRTKEK